MYVKHQHKQKYNKDFFLFSSYQEYEERHCVCSQFVPLNRHLKTVLILSSFLACGDLISLLTAFANCLDPDQDRQNVGPDLDQNCLTL